jgi:hypothetical protein
MLWLLFLMTVSCGPANRRDWEKKNSDNICGKIGHFLENCGIWMINHHIFKVFKNTICLAYFPETVMYCDDDYVNKPSFLLTYIQSFLVFFLHPTVTSAQSCNKVDVHKHWGNTFQRQNYKMRLKQRSLNWINSMQVKKILLTTDLYVFTGNVLSKIVCSMIE